MTIPARCFLACVLALAATPAPEASTWGGWVEDVLDHPVPEARVCWLADPSVCTTANDSGRFVIEIPEGTGAIGAGLGRSSFRFESDGRDLILMTPTRQRVTLDAYDLTGRRLFHDMIDAGPEGMSGALGSEGDVGLVPEGFPGGLLLLRASGTGWSAVRKVACLPGRTGPPLSDQSGMGRSNPDQPGADSPQAARLSKTAARPIRVFATKPGYRRQDWTMYENPLDNHITLMAEGDSGFFRRKAYSTGVLSIDSANGWIHTRTSRARCDDSVLIASVDTGSIRYGIDAGKLYLMFGPGLCQGSRLAGSGGVIGVWAGEDSEAELPPALRPDTCPPPLPGSRPIIPPEALTFTLSSSELRFDAYEEECPGWEIYYKLRNHFWADIAIHMTEQRCRQTVYRKGDIEVAAEYTPFGGEDSTRVTFTFAGRSCSYVDPIYSYNPMSGCPPPSERALAEFLACIDSTGFMTPAPALAKETSFDRPAANGGRASRIFRPTGNGSISEWLQRAMDSKSGP